MLKCPLTKLANTKLVKLLLNSQKRTRYSYQTVYISLKLVLAKINYFFQTKFKFMIFLLMRNAVKLSVIKAHIKYEVKTSIDSVCF